jgi:hypothetical protein
MFIEDKFCKSCEKITQHENGKCSICNCDNVEESKMDVPAIDPKFVED